MKYLIYIFIFLWGGITLCYAQPKKEKIKTSYFAVKNKIRGGREVPTERILCLKSDGTYKYKYRGGFHKDYSFGTWTKENKKIILKALPRFTDSIPLNMAEEIVDGDSIRIDFGISFGYTSELVHWKIVLNGKEYPVISNSSIVIKDISKVNSLFVKGYMNSEHIIPYMKRENIRTRIYYSNKKSNYFKLTFPPEIDYNIFYYIPLQDTLKVKCNGLKWKRKGYKTITLTKSKFKDGVVW